MCAILTYVIIKSTLVVFMSWPRNKGGINYKYFIFQNKSQEKKEKEGNETKGIKEKQNKIGLSVSWFF